MRFHLIDRIDEICYGRFITAVKCVSLADDVFNEHFPGFPVFPGTLVIEALAQLGGSLFELTMQHQQLPLKRAVLSLVKQTKLRRPVRPGDRMLLRADVTSWRDDFGVVQATAKLDTRGEQAVICAEGELLFSFVELQSSALQQSRQELYEVCTKNMRVSSE